MPIVLKNTKIINGQNFSYYLLWILLDSGFLLGLLISYSPKNGI